jgi:hypothetical protein
MKIIKVEYQVKPDFVESNKQNIMKVMEALKAKKITSFRYSSYYLGEGKFMHHNITNGDNFAELNELQEFKNFLSELKASEPIVSPHPLEIELVGSNMEMV